MAKEPTTNWSHGSIYSENTHPHVVDNPESSMEGMSTIFSLAHFHGFEEPTDDSRSLSQSLVDQILETPSVFK